MIHRNKFGHISYIIESKKKFLNCLQVPIIYYILHNVICSYIVAISTFSGNICVPAIHSTTPFLLVLFPYPLCPFNPQIFSFVYLLFVFGGEELVFILWLVQNYRMQQSVMLKVSKTSCSFPKFPQFELTSQNQQELTFHFCNEIHFDYLTRDYSLISSQDLILINIEIFKSRFPGLKLYNIIIVDWVFFIIYQDFFIYKVIMYMVEVF